MNRHAVLYALGAALLFGLATPLAKRLIGTIDPWMLAALFYLGSGLGLALLRALLRLGGGGGGETRLAGGDWPWMLGALLLGGVAGPLLLLLGLRLSDAATASLLLTLEGVATALLAWFLFRENFDRRIALGMGLIVAGAGLLAWQGGISVDGGLLGPLLIAGACLCWGLDNNLTRKVALADPLQIAMLKGLGAAPVTLLLALAVGAPWPPLGPALLAAAVGFLGYGVSLALFVLALRHLGTARTGAYFSLAPFVGALAAIPLADAAVTWSLALAGLLMAAGVALHLTERHAHLHEHEPLTHVHRHRHDAHHQHDHAPGQDPRAPHSHQHTHARLRHAHAHTPDSHHRHRHE